MSKDFKEPSFKETPLASPITKFALMLTAVRDGFFYPSGTATIVASHLAITAKHVVQDYWREFEPKTASPGENSGSFLIFAIQILNNGSLGASWNISRVWLSPFTDVAFLRLAPYSQSAQDYHWRKPILRLLPPAVGTRISGFGYCKSNIRTKRLDEMVQVIWSQSPSTTIGEVIRIHEEKRDSLMLNFPCFETNARFDGGMSGGPVFDDEGKLCGLICSSLPPMNEEESYCSHVATLWPWTGTPIDLNRTGMEANVKYPVLDLITGGFMKAEGFERVNLVREDNGEVIKVQLRQLES